MLRCFSIVLLLIAGYSVQAQSYSIYQNITARDGLPSNYVFGVGEDGNGFLWVATDKGLGLYDGFRWKVWNKDNGLPGNYIVKVFPDKKDGCWIVIPYKGIYHFRDGKATALKLRDDLVGFTSMNTDADGNLYLELGSTDPAKPGYRGLLFSVKDLDHPEEIFSIQDGPIAARLRANVKEKTIYYSGTSADSFAIAQKISNPKWRLHFFQLSDSVYKQNKDYTIFYISDSVLINPFNFIYRKGDNLVTKRLPSFGKKNTYAYTAKTNEGYYIHNIHTGYYFIDRNYDTIFYNSRDGLGTDYVNHIYKARDGSLIISTLGEGLRIIKNNYRKIFSTNGELVRTIIPANDQWYLLAGNSILRSDNSYSALTFLGKTGSSSVDMFRANDTLAVTSLNGISFYREGKENLGLIKHIPNTNGISHAVKAKNGFLAGTYGSALLAIDGKTFETAVLDYPLSIIERLRPLPNGFAALSYEDGAFITETATNKTDQFTQKDGLLSNAAYCVFADADTLWIGTIGGINAIVNKRVVRTLPFSGNATGEKALYCFRDQRHQLWVVSNLFLYQVRDARLARVASFPLVEKDQLITYAAYNMESDELGVGSGQSFNLIDLSRVVPDTEVAAPRLINAWLDDRQVNTSALDVPYDFNTLSFYFSPMSASSLTQNHVYYKLQGARDEWIEVKDSLYISFSGLRSGDYRLWVKTVNADEYESIPVQMATFTVKRPFWLRLPFLFVCIAATAIIAVLLARRAERANRKKREERLEFLQSLQRERTRISKDLHDNLGSNLAIIIAQTDNIESELDRGNVLDAMGTLQRLSGQTRDTMSVLRETVWAVQESAHTLEDFVIRIRTFLKIFYESTQVEWQVQVNSQENITLSPSQTLHLFRIIQEASQNIVKHSGGTKADYLFTVYNKRLELEIRDNGKGMTAPIDGYTNGITNIRTRVSELQGSIEWLQRNGLVIRISVPV